MKIWTHGCRESYCQLPRIEYGFVALGHKITQDIKRADLIYVNNAWYDEIINRPDFNSLKGKKIFNVLDCAKHIEDFPIEKLKVQLSFAHAITTISEYVQIDIRKRTGYDASIIYQPIQDIQNIPEDMVIPERKKKYDYDFMAVGRICDTNKRINLAVDALKILGISERNVLVTGTEYFGWGDNAGLVNNQVLSDIYNSVYFVFCLGKEEGICLPVVEAMAVGAIPVVCNDLTTRQELLPSRFFPEYDFVNPNALDVSKFIGNLYANPVRFWQLRKDLRHYYDGYLKERFSPLGVASRILKVYESIR